MTPDRLQELLAKARATLLLAKEREAAEALALLGTKVTEQEVTSIDFTAAGIPPEAEETEEGKDAIVEILQEIGENAVAEAEEEHRHGGKEIGVAKAVTLNSKQQSFNDLVLEGKSAVLIGPAGTGKTTGVGVSTRNLIASGRVHKLSTSTKWLRAGSPGVAILSYTRKAVNNIRYAVAEELKVHTLTIHKLLEFAPIFYEIEDPNQPGVMKKTMRFEPTRDSSNPLPPELKLLAFEESSMIAVDLYHQLLAAMPHQHQEVFLGDIQQLPPIFGSAILGFKMLELPVVELTEIYRQALLSPIITLAHKVLGGNPYDFSPVNEEVITPKGAKKKIWPALLAHCSSSEHGTVVIQPWQKKLSADLALMTATAQFREWIRTKYYDPEEDIILCPFNKAFGTIELNKGIAEYLGKQRGALVHEVIAGFVKHYLAIGDRVLYDKEDAYIVDIQRNGNYAGKTPKSPSIHLDREGHLQAEMTEEEKLNAQAEENDFSLEAIDASMKASLDNVDERVNAASHIVTIQLAHEEEGNTIPLDAAADINNLLGGYALTVHKFQGSENDKIFFLLHNSHATMVSRELLYTGLTRPKKFLHIICEGDTFYKGVQSQRIKGNTLAEKAEWFKGKADIYEEKKQSILSQAVGDYRETKVAPVAPIHIAPAVVIPPAPLPLVKIDTLVPQEVKNIAYDNLFRYWQRAKLVFGEEVGLLPVISFRLQSSRKLGTAAVAKGVIKLNAVWCSLAAENHAVAKEMLETTLLHEACHIIAYRYSKDKAHNEGWITAMKLMGAKPEKTYSGDSLPPYVEVYRELAARHKEKMAANADGELEMDNDQEEGDVA
jgi:hypothetical protein